LKSDTHTFEAVYDCRSLSKNTVNPVGEWNQCTIICDKIKIYLLKDIDLESMGKHHAVKEKFCELGPGLDISGVLQALQNIYYTNWIKVERDNRVEDYVQSAK
jgi:sugar phosphate isomerase/epimerase